MSVVEEPAESFLSALLRVFWMLLGHATALVLGLSIAALDPWSLGWRDFLYWLCIGAIVATRWLDVLHYGGTAGNGDPMTRPMLLRWSVGVVAAFSALWLGAQSIRF